MKNFFIALFLFGCTSISAQKMKVLSQKSELQAHINQEVILEGIMQMKKFENKNQAELGLEYYEFWLLLADGYKVLLVNKTGKPLSKEPFTKKVRIKGKLFYGDIDNYTQIEEKVQSRVGYRLDFTELKIIK